MKKQYYDYVILGAGLAGLSTAYFLQKAGITHILLIERQDAPGRGASSQNASMVCQIVRDPVLSRIMMQSARLMREEWLPQMPELSFIPSKSLHIGTEQKVNAFQETFEIAKEENTTVYSLTRQQTLDRCPILKDSSFEAAFECPTDGILDTHTLVHYLSKHIQNHGAEIITSHTPMPDSVNAGTWINAGGAWASEIAQHWNAQNFQITPTRRHVYVSKTIPDLPRNLPIVWDIHHNIYFRQVDNNSLMVSPCDEEIFYPDFYPPVLEGTAVELEEKLKVFLPALSDMSYIKEWAGLRSFTPDRRFVIGWDQNIQNFFWVAGLGGYGLTASARIGQLAAGILLGKSQDKPLIQALSPERLLNQKQRLLTPQENIGF